MSGGHSCCEAHWQRCWELLRCSGQRGSISLLLRIVGAFLIFDGVMVLFSFRSAGERETAFVQGVLTAAIGALLLIMPDTSIRMVFVLLGLWALVVGIGQLWTARKMDAQDSERGTAISLGALTSIAGVVKSIMLADCTSRA